MKFKCATCSEVYAEFIDRGPASTVVGICEPCGRLRLGDELYESAVGEAERESK